MKTYPTYSGPFSTRCNQQVEPWHDCVEWSAFYDVRDGILCACALAKDHLSRHQCCCGYEWGVGSPPRTKPVDAEFMAYMDKVHAWELPQN